MRNYSLEQKLFEAFTSQRGARLSQEDVHALLFDDAVGCCITNAACLDAGIEELGDDHVATAKYKQSWAGFKQRLKKLI